MIAVRENVTQLNRTVLTTEAVYSIIHSIGIVRERGGLASLDDCSWLRRLQRASGANSSLNK